MKCLDMFSSCFLSLLSSWICGCRVLPPQANFWSSHCTYIGLLYIVPRPTGAVLFLKFFSCILSSIVTVCLQVNPCSGCSVSNLLLLSGIFFISDVFSASKLPVWFKSHPFLFSSCPCFFCFLEHVEYIYNSCLNVLVY